MPASTEKLESLLQKKARLDQRIRAEKARLSKEERKKRAQRLIQIGGLAEIAAIGNLDKGALLGAMLEIAQKIKNDPAQTAVWKQTGDAVLRQREEQRKEGRKND